MRRGHPHPAYRVDLPAILGIDVCGEVVATGAEVEGSAPGDRVTANPYMPCGRCDGASAAASSTARASRVYNGTYAELFLVPAAFAVVVDPSVPDEYVAAFPEHLHHGLADARRQGRRLAGGHGLRLGGHERARQRRDRDREAVAGARVIASAGSEEKRERAAQLASRDLVLDHHSPELVARVLEATDGEGATIVFEHIGQATWGRSLELCAPGRHDRQRRARRAATTPA